MAKPSSIDFPELERRAREKLDSGGLVVDGALQWDNGLHRCGTKAKSHGRDGAYTLHSDYPQSVTWINYPLDGGEKHTEKLFDDVTLKLTKKERAALAETIRQAQEKRENERAESRRKAAALARQIYDASSPAGNDNAYLKRKGVPVVEGLKHDAQGNLIVPVFDRRGELTSLQTIAADGSKQFLKDGAIAGGFFVIPSADNDKSGALLLCEGAITGISLHLATGLKVVCALSCHNLEAVASYARERYPDREILICGDNDCTDKDGKPRAKNPGKEAAQAAGAAIGAAVAICPAVNGRSADFNDLHAAQGLDAVREVIEKVRGNVALPPRFFYNEKDNGALMYLKPTGKDDEFIPQKICAHISFIGRTHGTQWGYLFSFMDRLNRKRRIAIPARLFQLPGAEWAALLADNGMDIEPQMQKAFKECCLAMRDRLPLVRNVERTGWTYPGADDLPVFVLPDAVFSAGKAEIVFQGGLGELPTLYTQAGTLDGWKQLAELCAGNTRFVFALCVSFAGALIHLLGIDGGVFHLEGGSSIGKSTALRLAASVWGNPDTHIRTWRATDNGLESVMPLYNDNVLPLDELGQIGARALSEVSYMVSSGAGKTRANRSGGARALSTWRTVILSSGELGLSAKLAEDGLDVRAGQMVRFLGVPMTKEHLANLHGMEAGELIAKLNSLCRMHYGVAGRAFLDALVKEMATRDFMSGARKLLDDTAAQWTPQGADAQVMRVARRFAIVFVAGQFAQWFGTIPLSMDVHGSVRDCFGDWLRERGSAGEQETQVILEQVRTFLQKHGQSRFQDVAILGDKVINRAGFLQSNDDGATTFYIFPGVFQQEVIRGYSVKQAVKALRKAGWLITQSGGGGTINKRLPGMGQQRMFAVKLETAETETDS